MAFDAGMLSSSIAELKGACLGAKIEKIHQPERDKLILILRSREGGRRLLIDAGTGNPRLGFTLTQKENPAQPPMFCMLLRKHLTGAKLSEIYQPGFERVAELEFEAYDELGFPCKRYLIAEIMGKYSNLIFTDQNKKIISLLRTVDFTTSSLRQMLPGMIYELPPKQDKKNPLEEDEEGFLSLFESASPEMRGDKFITDNYLGISAAVAREICFRSTRHTDTPLRYCTSSSLWSEFSLVMEEIRAGKSKPCVVFDGERPAEYSFTPLTQYGEDSLKFFDSVGQTLDCFFETRDRDIRVKQRASDILHILNNAETRLTKKLAIQRQELADCEKGDEYKAVGDLITANIYLLQKGMTRVTLTDYSETDENGDFIQREIELDERLTPAQNAQRMYKKYNKSKTAKIELTRQIEKGEAELEYILSVADALSRADGAAELAEIREELYNSGYASKMKGYTAAKKKNPVVAKFVTDGGYTVLCGKNNIQNEYITHRMAEKNDYWFHAKGQPGSHVVMVCGGAEPDVADFTQAAEIAAFHSKATGENIAVDYTLARNVKKVAGGKPGLVIYHTNWTAYVTPSKEKIDRMKK